MIPAMQMSPRISSQWDDDAHSIIRVTHRPYWSWEELHNHEETVIAPLLLAAGHAVSLIVDMRSGPFFDPTATSEHVRQTGEMHRVLPVELIVFVLRDAAAGTLMKTLHERYGAPNRIYRLARTLDEARVLIREQRMKTPQVVYKRTTEEMRTVDRLAGD